MTLKRCFDVTVASTLLVLLAPVMLGVAIGVRLFLGSPVFFRQERVGHRGTHFRMVKFRSMRDAFDENGQPLPDEERMTRFGSLLRKSSLDELPELVNVLRGEMSLVGPRPIVEDERHHYGHHIAAYQAVRPGLTGAWQVSGRSDTTYEERVALDVTYVRERSTTLDLRIILRTVLVLLTARGAR